MCEIGGLVTQNLRPHVYQTSFARFHFEAIPIATFAFLSLSYIDRLRGIYTTITPDDPQTRRALYLYGVVYGDALADTAPLQSHFVLRGRADAHRRYRRIQQRLPADDRDSLVWISSDRSFGISARLPPAIHETAKCDSIDYNPTFIEADFVTTRQEAFDPEYMKVVFAYAYDP